MHNMILNAWQQKNLFYYLVLLPLSWLFLLLITLRRYCYKLGLLGNRQLSVPVIVVGNISLGGSGKTPLVIYIVEQLKAQGYRPGVISRGYGSQYQYARPVTETSLAVDVGDEPLLIAKRTQAPVFVGVDRVKVGQMLLAQHPECNVIISDDGMQHYKLARDIEIAMIDDHTVEKQRLLPAGPMREPISRLKTVDLMVTQASQESAHVFNMQLTGRHFYNLQQPTQQVEVSYFAGKQVAAIAGIGQPDKFFQQLTSMGVDAKHFAFADHHPYTAEELSDIDCEALLMTEKDAVKCQSFAQAHYWVLPVVAEVQTTFLTKLLSLLNKHMQNKGV